MPLNLDELVDKLSDDTELELGGEKVKAADLKSYLGGIKGQLTERSTALESERAERQALAKRFETFEGSTSALLREAARQAALPEAEPRQVSRETSNSDDLYAPYEQDPLFAPFGRAFEQRVLNNLDGKLFKPWVEKQLNPTLQELRQQNQMLTSMLLDERQHREYRDLNEWPEKFDLTQARAYGNERGYFLPGTVRVDPQSGRQQGIVDLRRVNDDLMTPIRQKKMEETIRGQAEEEALRKLRQNFQVIPIPNRTMNGTKAVAAKGRTSEEILGNAMQEASQDLETTRMLTQIVAGNQR